MNCSKCGYNNTTGDRFCKNCGILLENNQPQQSINNVNSQFQQPINNIGEQQLYGQPVNNINSQQTYQQQTNNQQYTNTNGNLDSNYVNKAVNKNKKKWAILSIVVPVVGIIWYWFIGLSFYLAVLIAAAGFGFAQKGEMSNKKLATIGKVCNGILLGMAIVVFIINLILVFNS